MASLRPNRLCCLFVLIATLATAQTLVLTPSTTMLNSAGGNVTFTAAITYPTTPSTLGFSIALPTGWSYVSGTSVPGTSPAEPAIAPSAGRTGLLEWAFINPPAGTATFTFVAAYAANTSGAQTLTSSLLARDGTGGAPTTVVPPAVSLPAASTFLSWNDGTGSWTDSSQWGPVAVPNNNGVVHYSATVAAGVATLNSAASIDNLTFNGGTINGTGNLTLTSTSSTWGSGIFAGTGELIIGVGGQIIASGSNAHEFSEHTIRNQGTFTWNGGGALQSGNGGKFINSAGSTFVDATTGVTDNLITNSTGGSFTFTNAGTYSKTSSSNTRISVPFTNTGNIMINAGAVQFTNAFTQGGGSLLVSSGATARFDLGLNFASGTLTGGGTVIADVSNDAFMSPGNVLGTLTVNGKLNLMANSVLSFDIGGTTQGATYDFLSVSGTATLGGTLAINFVNGARQTMLPTDTFTLLSASSISGSFANVASGTRLMSNFGQGSFLVTYSGSNLVLSNFDPVPEPSTWALLIGGLGVVVIAALRRKKS